MSDPKDFVAGIDSDQRRSPTRVVFVTRRTSAQVKVTQEDQVQTFPEVLFRAALAIELLAIALVLFSLFFNAPLEGLADPTHTPNPAKAPWYFLGLQELLHYFPPVVAGVLVPTLLIVAMIVIPYFNINIEATGLFLVNRARRLRIFYLVAAALLVFLLVFHVYVAIGPTILIVAAMMVAAYSTPESPSRVRRYLVSKPLAYWIMSARGSAARDGPGFCPGGAKCNL
jgi:quinol-cytochrome oxidoreductase complex cytochrome b subunit